MTGGDNEAHWAAQFNQTLLTMELLCTNYLPQAMGQKRQKGLPTPEISLSSSGLAIEMPARP